MNFIENVIRLFKIKLVWICSLCLLNGCNSGKFDVRKKENTAGSFNITDPASPATASNPLIKWTKSSGAKSYTVKISSELSCSSVLQNFSAIDGLEKAIDAIANGDYYVCVSADHSGAEIPASNNGFAFKVSADGPTAIIKGTPTGYSSDTNISVTISGGVSFKYKVVATSVGCSSSSGYSTEKSINEKVTQPLDTTLGYDFDFCAVAKDSSGNWQSFASASKSSWHLARLGFSGDSRSSTSIATRFFKNTSGNSSIWTLTGLCDTSLGSVTISGSGLNASTSTTCNSDGTFTKNIFWGGTTAPYLADYNGTILYGAKTISISQLGVSSVSTKIYQAATNHNLVLVPDLATFTGIVWNTGVDIGVNDYLVQTADITFDTPMTVTPVNLLGVYDGNGFALINFRNTMPRSMFSSIGAVGTASNINLVNATVSGVSGGKGVFTGPTSAGSVIHDLKVSGSISITGSTISGGVAGAVSGLILRVASSVNINSRLNTVGGIAASLAAGGTIDQAYSNATVTGTAFVGVNIGGIVGSNSGTVKNSYYNGTISHSLSAASVGGIVGIDNAGGTVSQCYTTSSISIPTAGASNVDFAVGQNAGTVDNSTVYFNNEASCTFNSGATCPGTTGGTGKTSSQLLRQATYSGFDFTSAPIWTIAENLTTATFPWQ